jgi:hypothetical protein
MISSAVRPVHSTKADELREPPFAASPGTAMPAGLYARVLGERWLELSEPVRLAHATGRGLSGRGCLRVERGPHVLVGPIAFLLALPHAESAAETVLSVTPRQDAEQWVRTIGGQRLETSQFARDGQVLCERFRMFEVRFDLDPVAGGLVYRQRGAALVFGPFGIPLPRRWAPRIEAREEAVDRRRTRITVRVVLPLIGLVVGYHGTIDFEGPS